MAPATKGNGTAGAVLAVERSQIGYNGSGTEDNPATKFGVWEGYDGSLGDSSAQWCLMFQNWCFSQAGIPILPEPGWNGEPGKGALAVAVAYNSYKAHSQFKATASNPAPGDLVFFQYPGNSAPDHVGMVENYGINTGLITSIQGNTTDAGIGRTGNCCRRKIHTRAYVAGFGTPKYALTDPDPMEQIMSYYASKAEFEDAVGAIAAKQIHAVLASDAVVGAAAYGPHFDAAMEKAVNDALATVLIPTPPLSTTVTQADLAALETWMKTSLEAMTNQIISALKP